MEIDAEKLILSVEKRPALYNYMLKEHHMKDVIEKLWDEVAGEVGAPLGADCKMKWNVLRGSYARYIRELNKLPNASAALKKKKWYLADSMSFIHSFVGQHRKSKGNTTVNDEDDEVSPTVCLENELPEESIIETKESTSSSTVSTQQTNDPLVEKTSKYPKGFKKRKTISSSEMIAVPMIEFLKKSQQPTQSADSNLKFFESLIPDVEKLSSKRKRIFKLKVMNVLNDLLEDQENEDSANSSVPSPYVFQSSPYASTRSSPSPCASTQYASTTVTTIPVVHFLKTERDDYADISADGIS